MAKSTLTKLQQGLFVYSVKKTDNLVTLRSTLTLTLTLTLTVETQYHQGAGGMNQ